MRLRLSRRSPVYWLLTRTVAVTRLKARAERSRFCWVPYQPPPTQRLIGGLPAYFYEPTVYRLRPLGILHALIGLEVITKEDSRA